MRVRSSRYIVAFVGLLVFLLSGQVGVQGYVLCVSGKGNIELETSLDGSCGSKYETAKHCDTIDYEFAAPLAGEHCGPCLDIPATHEISSRLHKLEKKKVLLASEPITSRILTPNISVRTAPARAPSEISPWVRQSILTQRTVVLLT